MRKVTLGKTGLEVSRICFGTWSFGGDWGSFDEDQADATIGAALEAGITFFDTAQGYGFGRSEAILGKALWSRVGRDDVVVATKGGLRMEGDRLLRDASPAWLRSGVESSLRHLGTDVIDLYQVHWPDEHTPPEETGAALAALIAEGKIRHAGVSNYDVKQMEALAANGPVETLQPPYHMFSRALEAEILPYAAQHDIGVLVYGPLAHGLLTGTITAGTTFAPDDWRSQSRDFTGETFAANLAVVERLKGVAEARGISLAQLAVAWTLARPAVHVAIIGARSPSHLDASAAAGDIDLSAEEVAEIDGILAGAVEMYGPHPEGM
jgi:aryl-alcohol dehydrogenase-like predicted oxidoreductase